MKRSMLFLGMMTALGWPWSTAHAHEVGKFPSRSVVGYFNGDGYLDKAVATPDADNLQGRVEIWLGDGTQSSLLGGPDVILSEAGAIFGGSPAMGNRFGAGLVVGDFDDDGRDDLAFGSPGAAVDGSSRAGLVYVVYGQDLLTIGEVDFYFSAGVYRQGANGVRGTAESYDYFGEFLGVGDLDCDSNDDLIIGAPRENLTSGSDTYYDTGVVHVLYGTGNGLTDVGDDYFSQLSMGGARASWDYFGAALTAGSFAVGGPGLVATGCETLVMGTPGKQVNGKEDAGVVYTSAGAVGGLSMVGQLWHQDVGGVDGTTAVDEEFGARLGTASLPVGEDLWIEIPGESCADPDETRYQVIRAGSSALTTTGDVRFCSRHEPGLADTEAGWIVEKSDRYGPYQQYLPTGVDSSSEVVVIIHGTPRAIEAGEDPTRIAADTARAYLNGLGWIEVAERENLILIAPGFDLPHFASRGVADDHPQAALVGSLPNNGGYRGLLGRDIQADAWVNEIVDSYQAVELAPTGDLYIYGHSAGAQMVSRYIVRNHDRLIAAAFSSPKSAALPTLDKNWPSGLDALVSTDFSWMNDDLDGTVTSEYSHTPSPLEWNLALAKPIFINVGEQEQAPWNAQPEGDGIDHHVETAVNYEIMVDSYMSQQGLVSGVELCIVPGIGHTYGGIYRTGIEQLFPNGDTIDCVPPLGVGL